MTDKIWRAGCINLPRGRGGGGNSGVLSHFVVLQSVCTVQCTPYKCVKIGRVLQLNRSFRCKKPSFVFLYIYLVNIFIIYLKTFLAHIQTGIGNTIKCSFMNKRCVCKFNSKLSEIIFSNALKTAHHCNFV